MANYANENFEAYVKDAENNIKKPPELITWTKLKNLTSLLLSAFLKRNTNKKVWIKISTLTRLKSRNINVKVPLCELWSLIKKAVPKGYQRLIW